MPAWTGWLLCALLAAAVATAKVETQTTTVVKAEDGKVVIRAPKFAVGGQFDEIITLRGYSGNLDAGFRCHAFDLREAFTTDVHITDITPYISTVGTEESVHHMDIFTCKPAIEGLFPRDVTERNDWCGAEKFITNDHACQQMIWAYDRGARRFTYPDDVGIRLGPSTGTTHLMLQIHYLLPLNYKVGKGAGIMDESGFDLAFTAPRRLDTHLIGFLDMGLLLPPRTKSYKFSVHLSSADLALLVGPDFVRFGEVQPFAAHLHAHDHAKAVWLDHYRGGEKIGEYASVDPFHGYGPDQSFIHVPKGSPPLRPGDSLTFTCMFDTSAVDHKTVYGVSWGDEMCAPLILYYPHVVDSTLENVVVFEEHEYVPDVSVHEVNGILEHKFGHWKKSA
jgi:dopamine beta-monooxygenase